MPKEAFHLCPNTTLFLYTGKTGCLSKALPVFVFFYFTSPSNALVPFSLFPSANVDFAAGMPSARGEIAIALRCRCCICKWQHCDSSLSLHRPRHPTQKAIRDKDRIDRDNTRSQSKHAREMLSAQTAWNQLSPEAREIVRWCWGREWNIEWCYRPTRDDCLCVISMNSHFCGLRMWVCSFSALARMKLVWNSDFLQGSCYEKSHFAWDKRVHCIKKTYCYFQNSKFPALSKTSIYWNLVAQTACSEICSFLMSDKWIQNYI